MRESIAQAAGVSLDAVALTVSAASVRLSFTVVVDAPADASGVAGGLQEQMGSAQAASTLLSSDAFAVAVEAVEAPPAVSLVTAADQPPGSQAAQGDLAIEASALSNAGSNDSMLVPLSAAAAAATVLVLAGLALLFTRARLTRRTRRRHQVGSSSSGLFSSRDLPIGAPSCVHHGAAQKGSAVTAALHEVEVPTVPSTNTLALNAISSEPFRSNASTIAMTAVPSTKAVVLEDEDTQRL